MEAGKRDDHRAHRQRTGADRPRRHGGASFAAALVCATLLSVGCGDDSGSSDVLATGQIDITIVFPSTAAQAGSAAVHGWAIVTEMDINATCAALVAAEMGPYDPAFHRLAEAATTESVTALSLVGAERVETAVIYVESIGFGGTIDYAGCTSTAITEMTAVSVSLLTAGVADCSNPAVEEGTPCDDGQRCTVGETCSGGACIAGVQRDCTFVADDCNAESCTEEDGCVASPLPNDTPCDDTLYCTVSDVCTEGTCRGQQRNCEAGAPTCMTTDYCDEDIDQCMFRTADDGTTCDDGVFCTDNDVCTFGSCYGSALDCTSLDDQCNNGQCDETAQSCVAVPVFDSTPCNDGVFCTDPDVCTGGTCGGSPRDCAYLNAECSRGFCDEVSSSCLSTGLPSGTLCNDGSMCTTASKCDGGGGCVGTTIDCSSFADACHTATCNPSTGCGSTFIGFGQACDDGDACTMNTTCGASQTCTGGAPTDLDGDGYVLDSCTATNGDCEDGIFAVNPGATEGPAGDAVCTDTLDNDCDGNVDNCP